MIKKFEELKNIYDLQHGKDTEVNCFLPVHLKKNIVEKNLYKVDGTHNEQYFKWQFLNCFVEAGLCSKDFIGVEVQFPKGNKNSKPIKMDAAIFDDENWFSHYELLHTKKDDSKWDELEWLKDHLVCTIEFKKENSKDVKGVYSSQVRPSMEQSTKDIVFGILYDEGRLYLFKSNGKKYTRLSDEFNVESKGKINPTFDIPDAYENLLSFDDMINYDNNTMIIVNYSGRKLEELGKISKTDSKRLNDALYQILHTMDKCGLVNQKGYNILIQLLALKIYDEKHNSKDLQYYVNQDEVEFKKLSDDGLQEFLDRIEKIRKSAKTTYSKILNDNSFDRKNINQVKVVIEIVRQFQNYSFSDSKRNNLYQLVFYRFASQFSKADNAQFVTPLQIIDFIVDIVNPKHNESIIDPTVGIADFLSVSYVKSNGTLKDENIFGLDIDEDMVKLATLNMLLNGDGQATIEAKSDGLGSINTKFDIEGKLIELVPQTSKKKYNYNGDWDNRPDDKELKKFDVVLTNPPFGDARAWEPKGNDREIAECYELWNIYNQQRIDLGVIFLENAVRILKDNGRMAIVLSNSIASIDAHKEARKWLCENMRVVAIIDLPANIFAEAGVSPTIIIAYKAKKEELKELQKSNYQVFSREIKKVGYEVKTKNKVKCFETQYKINPITFEKEINSDGSAMLDEEFTETINDFKQWCNRQENTLKKLFL
ncbi:TPA: N-6 DNA methylase [Clostridioides difficile]|uniref:HsdM family class I SAM-dependent methyltransferase n=1 Tax=Clostridioides difficile TaxID=1496 RepID=UPI001025F552|nr:N-6 DNA methylase [Clostridioides difficile]VFG98919.1 type i restriction enzyme m subunit [Clostridioides difficile]VIB36657.1 type i restriction enzyme m subunit [Clostridioides difficile]VIB64660.1 type i restriction enzyme m subunit [Clostridioides difficile]VII10773.1 type i restriction enzyme m subunit [Clostridioides difficile]VII33962.1 type i restriction enzyme m subunit [Clostridioides difficile]